MEQARLTGVITPKYDGDRYPETLMVVMSDGRTVRYRIDIYRPNRSFLNAMGILRKPEYFGKHAKKEPDAVTAAPAREGTNKTV